MMFGSHMVVAAAGFVAYTHVGTQGQWSPFDIQFWMALGVVLVGAMLPDLDHPDSTVGKRLGFLAYPITIIFGHRGLTHSLIAVGGLFYLAYAFESVWLWWLAFGYTLHLVGDYLTDSGVPLLWPLRKRYRFLLVTKTNSFGEPVLVTLFVGGCTSVLLMTY